VSLLRSYRPDIYTYPHTVTQLESIHSTSFDNQIYDNDNLYEILSLMHFSSVVLSGKTLVDSDLRYSE
jgi:hypothetical protein